MNKSYKSITGELILRRKTYFRKKLKKKEVYLERRIKAKYDTGTHATYIQLDLTANCITKPFLDLGNFM